MERKNSPVVYLFAGTNGSGKSTLLVDFIREEGIEDAEYICQGFHSANLFSEAQKRSPRRGGFHLRRMERALAEKRSMILEHALADQQIFAFLERCKSAGYRIVSVFVHTQSPLVNLRRVRTRMREGGHGVSAGKIVSRYSIALCLLPRLVRLSDEFYLFDNSSVPRLVKARFNGLWFDAR